MEDGIKDEDRESKSRLPLLLDAQKGSCVADCNGQWKQLAQQMLERNNSGVKECSLAVINLLVKGNGKGRNYLIAG